MAKVLKADGFFLTADTSVMFSVLEELFERPIFDSKATDIKMDEIYTHAVLKVLSICIC